MTIYTKHSIHSAATEMARIYENSSQKNQIIIGLDAQGNVDYGFKNVTPIPVFITKINTLYWKIGTLYLRMQMSGLMRNVRMLLRHLNLDYVNRMTLCFAVKMSV